MQEDTISDDINDLQRWLKQRMLVFFSAIARAQDVF